MQAPSEVTATSVSLSSEKNLECPLGWIDELEIEEYTTSGINEGDQQQNIRPYRFII